MKILVIICITLLVSCESFTESNKKIDTNEPIFTASKLRDGGLNTHKPDYDFYLKEDNGRSTIEIYKYLHFSIGGDVANINKSTIVWYYQQDNGACKNVKLNTYNYSTMFRSPGSYKVVCSFRDDYKREYKLYKTIQVYSSASR